MEREAVEQLVAKAKQDPQFFHALVFNPEQVLGELKSLDRKSKAAILAFDPEAALGELAARAEETAALALAGSCKNTCNRSCRVTCQNAD